MSFGCGCAGVTKTQTLDPRKTYTQQQGTILINELIRIEKRTISNVMPGVNYNNACEILGITLMVDYIDPLCDKLFHNIASDEDHRLNSLLPP